MSAPNLIDTIRQSVVEHPYIFAAAGGAVLAAAGSIYAMRQRIMLERLDRATDEEIEEQIQTGAIAY